MFPLTDNLMRGKKRKTLIPFLLGFAFQQKHHNPRKLWQYMSQMAALLKGL
jgi:hypothetical protein